jgi:predicted TIM-barrel fold metal-dependent hydrolase
MDTEAAPVVARHAPIRQDWLALHREDILEPALPIVDPHHHLWDRPHNRYFLPDLLADTGSGHNVVATVFVECRAMYRATGPEERRPRGETEFVNGIAAMSASGLYGATRVADGIVGHVDLRLGERARAELEAHCAAAPDRFRGIRHIAAWHGGGLAVSATASVEGLLLDAGFRRGFAALAPLGLSFDAWLMHTQLEDLLDLARAFPGTSIVLNHIGGPIGIGPYEGKRQEVFALWKRRIEALAGCANITIKIGGLGMGVMGFALHERSTPPTSEELALAWRPYVETCIAAFGPKRCMFESNFPVDKASCSYAVLWNTFKRIAAGCSLDEKAALFSGTARRVYRLGDDA